MTFTPEQSKQILDHFKIVFTYKEEAKNANASASETMKSLIENLTADKKERKELRKLMRKAFRSWVEAVQGEDQLTDTIQLVSSILDVGARRNSNG